MVSDQTTPQAQAEKKSYRSPQFAQYGTIQNLTLGGTGREQEGKAMLAPMMFP